MQVATCDSRIPALETQTGISPRPRRRLWPLALYVSVALGCVVAAFFLDAAVYHFVNDHKIRWLRRFMHLVSEVGDWPSHAIAGLLGAGLAFWRRRREWVRIFLAMVLACAVAGLINRGVKIGLGRPRPSVKQELAWKRWTFDSDYQAFPSGHTAATTAFFGVLLFSRKKIGLALLPIPILIGASRIYVNAHYLSDVLAATVLGLGTALIIVSVLRLRAPPLAESVSRSG